MDRAKIFGTKNGVRIKTWQGGSGSASNIQFQNIEMDNGTNPIITNQNYCDKKKDAMQNTAHGEIGYPNQECDVPEHNRYKYF
ncbi:hypothetical protein JHK87_053492 [Glycine soja]|nr:hypothetical protein JHK87_053492 [Glycine soja]